MMSEGDVSLIQDEDVLRRMWQQTEDMTKRKEIRAHMYKLREERLKTLYAEPTQAESKGFTTSGGHTDSFADQCFQSIKSKEVRDSESPTRDYHYKVEGADNSNGGWTVVNKNEVSDDGRTKTESSVAHTSGTREIDGGNATFAALNENEKTVSQFEDENTKQFSAGESSKTVAREQFVADTGDGKVTSSTVSSVGSSHKQSSYSQKFESNVDDDDDVDVTDFSRGIVDNTSRVKSFKSSTQDSKNVQNKSSNRVVSSKVTSSVVDDTAIQAGDGELVSKKVEHPDEFTKVTTETRRLPDGTMVTSTSREIRGSYTSKSGKQSSDHYDSSTASRVSTSEQHVNKQLKSHIDNETKVISTDKISEKKLTSYVDDDVASIRSVNDDVNFEDVTSTVRRVGSVKINKSNNQREDIDVVSDVSNIKVRQDYETHYKTPENDVKSVVDDERYVEHVPISKSHIENITSEDIKTTKVDLQEVEEPYQPKKTVYPLDNDCPKQDSFPTTHNIMDKATTGEYVTTYQTDYTSKKITEDLSPTHNAWASSLRSSPDSPLHTGTPRGTPHGTPSVRSFRTSTSSLRSSISPEKKYRDYPAKTNERTPSPKKSPTRVSSERDVIVKKTREDNKRDYSPEKLCKTIPERNTPRGQSPNKNYNDQKNRPVREDFDRKRTPSTSPSRRSPTKTSTQEHISLYSTTKTSSPSSPDTSPNRSPVRNVPLKKTPDIKTQSPKRVSPNRSPVRSLPETYIYQRKSPSKSPSLSPTRQTPTVTKTNKFVSPSTSPVRTPTKSSNVTTPRGSPAVSPTRNSSPRKQSTGSHSPTRGVKGNHPNNTTPTQPKSVLRSRDSSPTTSVSEIEYISRVKNVETTVDSSDDENVLNIRKEVTNRKKTDTSEKVDTSTLVRKSSLKKTSVTGTDTFTKSDVNKVKNTHLDDEDDRSFENHRVVKKDRAEPEEPVKENKPRVKSPYVRSETYEERCRKILGMPDKKTLVEGAEKNLSEILGNLSEDKTFGKIISGDDDDVDRTSPNRELTTGVKSAELTDDSSSTLNRISSLRKNEQVRNLVDAEYIKLDSHGNVVSADAKEFLNKENNYKMNDNKIKTEKLIEGERVQEQRNRKSSPSKNFLETEKRDIENTRRRQSEFSDTNENEKVTKEINSTITDDPRENKPSSTTKTDDNAVCQLKTTTITVKESTVGKKPRSLSPKKESRRPEPQNHSPERKPKVQDTDDKATPKRSTSPQKYHSPERKPKVQDTDDKATPKRSTSPQKYYSPERKPKVPDSEDKVTPKRSTSPQKYHSPERKPKVQGIDDKVAPTSKRSVSPQKHSSPERKPKVQDIDDKVTPKRSSSPQKPDSRSSSPQKIKNIADTTTTSQVTKTCKTTKDQSDIVSSDKKTNLVDRKQTITKVNKPTTNVSVTKKPEPTRTILTSQKYNIFKDDKKKSEIATKKKDTVTNVTTKTTTLRNMSEKISNVQSTVLSKFEKDKNKINTDIVEKKTSEIRKKPHEEKKNKDIPSPKMHRSSIDTKTNNKTSNATETKITRTASDIGMKSSKPEPTRMRSKPEINITKTTTMKGTSQVKNSTVTNRSNITTTQLTSKTTTKSSLKSKLTKGTDETDIIIDIQHAKSSRENSPDHICPLPVSNEDDRNNPRYPDNVTEPDDHYKSKKRVHDTISESDAANQSRIIELSDSEDETTRTKVDHRTKVTDNSRLSVTEKVTKFSNTNDSRDTTVKTNDMKKHKKIITDEVESELRSDDCLLSVSDKVTKFINASDNHKSKVHHQKVVSNDFLKHEISDSLINDECLLSVNDKVSRFLNAAEKVTEPIKLSQPTPKPLKPDVYVVDKGTKNISDKPSRRSGSPIDKLVSSEKSPGLVSKASKMINDVKSKFENVENTAVDIHLTVQKETIASQAKKSTAENKYVHLRTQTSPDRLSPEHTSPRPSLTPEKTPEKKPVSILKNSDNVKKAKALFENIANQKPEPVPLEPSSKRATKLTDIGVFKKSPTAESVPDAPAPKRELDDSSVCTESDSETDKMESRRRSIEISQNIYNKAHRLSSEREVTEVTTKTSRLSNAKHTHTYDDESHIIENQKKTSKDNQEVDMTGEDFVSTRRGSGKFGVELRRTNTEQSFTNDKKRKEDPQSQPTIEDINDLFLLEQMLEKVSGYEQRRRIRSQMRIVKKNLENSGKLHLYETTKSRQTTKNTTGTVSKDEVSHTNIERRKVSPVRGKDTREISPTRKATRQTVTTTTVETKTRSTSPDKKAKTSSPDRKRSTSPIKKTTDTETTKVAAKKTYTQSEKIEVNSETDNVTHQERVTSPSRSRISKVSEYTTAYLRKIGASNNLKSEYLPKVPNIVRKDREEIVSHQTSYTTTRRVSNTSEKNETTKIVDTESEYISRSPSPRRSQTPNERIYVRTPSPDLKKPRQHDVKSKTEYQNAFTNFKTKLSSKDLFSKTANKQKIVEDKPDWATTNILRKTTNETKVYSTKKSDDKTKTIKRSQSPSKAIRKPTDVITSSYGVGPTDENGKPLFGIKALRKHSSTNQNYEVKGTVVTKEFHSVNGGPPEGHVTVTAYSSDPTDLTNVIDRVESHGTKVSSDVKRSLHEKQNSRSKGVSSITTTTRYGGSTGNQVSRIHKSNQPKAIEAPRGQPPVGRRGSVKCLTEKFIKNAVDTSKAEKSTYPKAGLILRTSSFRDNASASASSRSSTPGGVVRTDSNTSVNSTEMNTSRVEHHHQQSESHMSFLDSNTKVTGVQDIITRMKNADIVIQDGDSMEDAEARALLNKFLGATVLMHGMSGYTEDKTPMKECKRETRTVVTKTSTVSTDIDDIWDERILRKLLEDSDDYEERRRLRARLRQVMAEQEACAQIVADAAESAGRLQDFVDVDSSREQLDQIQQQHDGECLPEPLLRDVHGALSRLQGALRSGPAPAPRGTALLDLVARLQAGLLAQEPPPKPPTRRPHKNRHTVGVTREELADARKLMAGIAYPERPPPPPPPPTTTTTTVENSLPTSPYALQKQNSFSTVIPPSGDKYSASAPQTPVKNNIPRPFTLNFQAQKSQENSPTNPNIDFHEAVSAQQKSYPAKQQATVVQTAAVKHAQDPTPQVASNDEVAKIVQESLFKAAQKKTVTKVASPEPELTDSDESDGSTVKMDVLSDDGRTTPVVDVRITSRMLNDVKRPFQNNLQNQNTAQPPKQYSALPNGVHSNGILKSRDLNKFIVEKNRMNEAEPPAQRVFSKQNKKLIMKRANTIDIPKSHRYQNDSDDDGDSGNYFSRDLVAKPKIPDFKPKTDNDKKFLAFIQQHNNDDSSSLWAQNNQTSQRNGGCNWKSCFGSIKNVFESTNAESESRPGSLSSAKNFWKATDEPANFSKPKTVTQRLTKQTTNFNDNSKKAPPPKLPWTSESKGNVVTGSLMVTAPKITNGVGAGGGGVSDKVLKLIPVKPAPVNQFSHAPMSAFKPLPKKIATSPVPPSPQVWSPPSVSGRVKHLAEKEFSKSEKTEPDKNNCIMNKPPIQKYIPPPPTVSSHSPISSNPPWAGTNASKENSKVLSLANNKFETPPSLMSPQSPNTPTREKPLNSFSQQNGQASMAKRLSLPQALPASGPLSAPHLVQKLENLKNQMDKESEDVVVNSPTKFDAEKLQIEFYEKQIREKARKFPSPTSVVPITRRFSEHIPDNYTYTVTDFTPPAPVSTFSPLPQIPDIEETIPQPSKKLPDLVLNNQSPPQKRSPDPPKTDIVIKPIEKEDESLDQKEYKAVTKVMKAPVPQQVTIKTNNKQDTYEKKDNAAKSLKGVLQKFSSPKHDVITQIEKKKQEMKTSPTADQVQKNVSTIETTKSQKISTVSSKVSEETTKAAKPVSPFAKFRQLDRQNSSQSSPNSPKTPLTPTGGSLFKFTDPQLQASASNIKERLLQWCRDKTQDYENVKLDNFSTSWSDGLAFCALIHHFLPEEFDFTKLTAQQRRHNFTLAFKVADEKAGIYPLLDVEDMVTMRKPDWKCVFTYVQAIHRRFKDQD
ncbi:uncharacterized protein LOC143920004 [Arctopsyche grandis]|uniref:uncharacterized protein LOC143920004 n=1 Tax=Arctopsyche grandis TaxID=121162 RepID=UPI00406D77F3